MIDFRGCLPLSPVKTASGKSLKGARDVPSGRGENDSELDGPESDFPSEVYEGSSTVTMVGTVSKKLKSPKCSPDQVSSSSSTLKVSPIM